MEVLVGRWAETAPAATTATAARLLMNIVMIERDDEERVKRVLCKRGKHNETNNPRAFRLYIPHIQPPPSSTMIEKYFMEIGTKSKK